MKLNELMKVVDRWADIDVYDYEGKYRSLYEGPALGMVNMFDADVVEIYDAMDCINIHIKLTNPWICTDEDEAQYQRKLSDDLYEMYGTVEVPYEDGRRYIVNHRYLCVSSLERDKRYADNLLKLYGYDGDGEWRDVLMSYDVLPEMCEPLLVEMAFENSLPVDDAPMFATLDDAANEIEKAIKGKE